MLGCSFLPLSDSVHSLLDAAVCVCDSLASSILAACGSNCHPLCLQLFVSLKSWHETFTAAACCETTFALPGCHIEMVRLTNGCADDCYAGLHCNAASRCAEPLSAGTACSENGKHCCLAHTVAFRHRGRVLDTYGSILLPGIGSACTENSKHCCRAYISTFRCQD